MVRRAQALLDFVERFGLDRTQAKLLSKVLEGLRGPELAAALGLPPAEVDALERRFAEVADRSVYEAAVDVLSAARRDSSIRPPPPDGS
jgi:Flp pilus assembly CpaE family ATPase